MIDVLRYDENRWWFFNYLSPITVVPIKRNKKENKFCKRCSLYITKLFTPFFKESVFEGLNFYILVDTFSNLWNSDTFFILWYNKIGVFVSPKGIGVRGSFYSSKFVWLSYKIKVVKQFLYSYFKLMTCLQDFRVKLLIKKEILSDRLDFKNWWKITGRKWCSDYSFKIKCPVESKRWSYLIKSIINYVNFT